MHYGANGKGDLVMPKIVIVGKCKFDYEVLAVPKKMLDTPEPTEEGFLLAIKKFYPAIEKCDLVIVYAPDGISEHMRRDIDYARKKGKPVFRLEQMTKRVKVKRLIDDKRPTLEEIEESKREYYRDVAWQPKSENIISPAQRKQIELEDAEAIIDDVEEA